MHKKDFPYFTMKKTDQQTIIVTGGAGYIGAPLTRTLLSLGYRVVVIDDLSQGYASNVPKDAVLIPISILSPELSHIFQNEKPSCVFHLAASKSVTESVKNPEQFYLTNVIGSKNVIDAAYACGTSRVIFTSTAGVYGDTIDGRLQRESDTLFPSSPYAETKHETEKYLLSMNARGMYNVIVRFANVYGPGGKAAIESVIHVFIRKLREEQNILIHGDGNQTRDYVFIDDLVDACIRCINAPKNTKNSLPIYNVSTGKPASVLDVLAIISGHLKKKPPVTYIKDAFIGQKSSLLDPSKTKHDLGWESKVPLEDGIKKTFAFFRHTL